MLLSRQTVTQSIHTDTIEVLVLFLLKQVICHSSLAVLTLMGSVICYTSGCIGILLKCFSVPESSVWASILYAKWISTWHKTWHLTQNLTCMAKVCVFLRLMYFSRSLLAGRLKGLSHDWKLTVWIVIQHHAVCKTQTKHTITSCGHKRQHGQMVSMWSVEIHLES